MADFTDIASDSEEIDRARALASIVRYQGISASECEECGEAIAELRRKALPGVVTCIDCAELREMRR